MPSSIGIHPSFFDLGRSISSGATTTRPLSHNRLASGRSEERPQAPLDAMGGNGDPLASQLRCPRPLTSTLGLVTLSHHVSGLTSTFLGRMKEMATECEPEGLRLTECHHAMRPDDVPAWPVLRVGWTGLDRTPPHEQLSRPSRQVLAIL